MLLRTRKMASRSEDPHSARKPEIPDSFTPGDGNGTHSFVLLLSNSIMLSQHGNLA